MNFDVVFKEKDIELQADFGSKIELNHLIVQSMTMEKVYAISSSSTDAPTEWVDEAPTPTTDKPYLWMKTNATYTVADGTVYAFSDKGVVVGAKGEKGEQGIQGEPGVNGQNGADGYTPVKGKDYFDGTNGKDGTSVTVFSVSESTADGGSNVVTFSDGKTVTIKNGSKGGTGAAGTNGKDGKTPVKGTDYYTEADKTEMVNAVIAALPKYAGEVVSV